MSKIEYMTFRPNPLCRFLLQSANYNADFDCTRSLKSKISLASGYRRIYFCSGKRTAGFQRKHEDDIKTKQYEY
jgi:hypothetical protein